VQHWDDVRLLVEDEAEVADEALVEDRVDLGAVVRGALGDALDADAGRGGGGRREREATRSLVR